MLEYIVEIQRQSAVEEAGDSGLEPKARTVPVSKLPEGLGHTETGIKVFEQY
jgi:hypothetical protein